MFENPFFKKLIELIEIDVKEDMDINEEYIEEVYENEVKARLEQAAVDLFQISLERRCERNTMTSDLNYNYGLKR